MLRQIMERSIFALTLRFYAMSTYEAEAKEKVL